MFIGVITWISPFLSSITLIFMLLVFMLGIASRYMLKNNLQKVTEASVKGNGLFSTVNQALDTVRLFDHRRFMARQWSKNSEFFLEKRAAVSDQQDFIQSITRSVQSIMSVAIYATGATLAVKGELPVGTLIGINILAMRALGPISRFTQLGESFTMASQAMERIEQFGIIETERQGGVALKSYQGKLRFKDISFAHPGMPNPLFETLDLEIPPGGVLVVAGENGTGKTTLCRLVSGLLEPDRGQILADGVDIRQLSPSWWRSQLACLPQDSQFLQGSIRENLEAAMPLNAAVNQKSVAQASITCSIDSETTSAGSTASTSSAGSTASGNSATSEASGTSSIDLDAIDESIFTRVIKDAGLLSLIDQSPLGLDTQIVNNGANLSAGHRKRLALARALAVGGKLVLFDEPTEGLDKNGCATVYSLLVELSKKRYTMIIFTQDPNIIRGATRVLDLNSKPVPKIVVNHPNAGTDSHNAGTAGSSHINSDLNTANSSQASVSEKSTNLQGKTESKYNV
ncbi:MAG: ATP-binding cassette domain-containing protein [Desulfamplus sp.]|nr:ATP-binding cassette domain-containing protein [Desulfamplus sp.]